MNDEVIKLSPIDEIARQLGGHFGGRAGWRLPEVFSTVEAEEAAARERVALADRTGNGKILIEGDEAAAVVATAWDGTAPATGQGAVGDPGRLFRLRADLFFASTPPGAESEAVAALNEAAGQVDGLVTVTDVTHGRAELWLVGPDSAELLSRLCSLDLHLAAFPDLSARQSSVAKTSQLILRNAVGGVDAFALIGDRSLAAYLWRTIMAAGEDLGLTPLGLSAFEQLDKKD